MNIQDFKFYRKNNRYYFESHELEGRIVLRDNRVYDIFIDNGDDTEENWEALEDLFNSNIELVLAAESL